MEPYCQILCKILSRDCYGCVVALSLSPPCELIAYNPNAGYAITSIGGVASFLA